MTEITEPDHWLPDVKESNYAAAEEYLSLRFTPTGSRGARRTVKKLRSAAVTTRRVNDILRACDRTPLPVDDPGVRRVIEGLSSGGRIGPVLVVSFAVGGEIADGFHRLSAIYHLDPFARVPLKLAFV